MLFTPLRKVTAGSCWVLLGSPKKLLRCWLRPSNHHCGDAGRQDLSEGESKLEVLVGLLELARLRWWSRIQGHPHLHKKLDTNLGYKVSFKWGRRHTSQRNVLRLVEGTALGGKRLWDLNPLAPYLVMWSRPFTHTPAIEILTRVQLMLASDTPESPEWWIK